MRAIGNPITNSNTLTRARPIKNVLLVTRSSHAIINEFRIKFILKKEKKCRGERYCARVERKTTTVPTEPWLCSQLLLAPL